MNDILPPRRPLRSQQPTANIAEDKQSPIISSPVSQPAAAASLPPVTSGPSQPQSIATATQPSSAPATDLARSSVKAGRLWNKNWKNILLGLIVLVILTTLGGYLWYRHQLTPLQSSDTADSVAVEIPSGTTPDQIASILVDKSLIRSKLAFNIHTRLQGVRNQLLAGTYRLSPSESMPEIVSHLTKGQNDEFTVTFYPGSALNFTSGTDQTPSHRAVLERLGYSGEEIDEAFNGQYDHPLLASKPQSADLEGYIYGQTYQISSGSSVKQLLTRTFDEFYAQLQKHNVPSSLEERGVSLHDAIILASVVEREVSSNLEDQRQVAQVFDLRLKTDMPLGADATFVYAAKRLDQAPTVDIDSPYNTRRYKGLPPGPIASPGIDAMRAVANPASGDFLFFVSGDDGKNYFSRTVEEHESKTRQYCIKNCSLF